MDGLHCGHHPDLGETRDVLRVEVLGVLDPPAQIAGLGNPFIGLFIDIEGGSVGPIPDGVRAELEAVFEREPRGFAQLLRCDDIETDAAGEISVGFEQPRAV